MPSTESLFSAASDASGILSDIDPNILPDTQDALNQTSARFHSDQHAGASATDPTYNDSQSFGPKSPHHLDPPHSVRRQAVNAARLDLTQTNTADHIATTRHLLITGTDPHRRITTLNPIKLQTDIDTLCGPLSQMEYLKNGTIIATTFTADQTTRLLQATVLPSLNLPITVSIAWSRQFTYGKVYAPELSQVSLEDILDALSPHKVVAVRKLLSDPAKAHIPLYVLTFLGPTPAVIRVGYVNYTVDRYYPVPLRCRKCWRLRHSTHSCRSLPTCNFCSSTAHTRLHCTETVPKCINCQGAHESLSPQCPLLRTEQQVCMLQADLGISFAEARRRTSQHSRLHQDGRLLQNMTQTPSQLSQQPSTYSAVDFPQLSRPATRTSIASPSSTIRPESSYVTPGQHHSINTIQGPESLPLSSPLHAPLELSLPLLTPHSPRRQPASSYSAVLSQSTNESPSPIGVGNPPHPPWFSPETFAKLVPLLIKLLFASTITDKIECITDIGHQLGLHTLIASTLSSLQLSSCNPPQ